MKRLRREPLLRMAAVTLLFFVLLRVGGADRHVAVLSGTVGAAGKTGVFLGLLYALSWLSVVLLVPVLTLAGVASVVMDQRRGVP